MTLIMSDNVFSMLDVPYTFPISYQVLNYSTYKYLIFHNILYVDDVLSYSYV
jgi:hypothetical protein